MKKHHFLLSAWLVAGGLGISTARAQQSVQAAGGTATGPGGTVSYSVGQVAYLGGSGPGGSSTLGAQQPVEIFVLSSTGRAALAVECALFPNPATDALTLRLDAAAAPGLSWQLTDLSGRRLGGQRLRGPLTTIPLTDLAAGAYLLRLSNAAEQTKTFKIIKH